MLQTDDRLQNEIRDIIAKIVEAGPEKILPQTNFVEELGMDSMMAFEIMSALEKKYSIYVPEEDLPKITNLEQVLDLVRALLQRK